MGRLILVTGGVRSGKSDFAQALAAQMGEAGVLFVATAEAGDAEMAARIAEHQRRRPSGWRTLEVPRQIGAALRTADDGQRTVVVDCLTMLVSNVTLSLGEAPEAEAATRLVDGEIRALLEVVAGRVGAFVVVTNEVGWGVVPATPLGRLFRDLLGRANQLLARHADEVYLMVSGIAVNLKAVAVPTSADPAIET